MFNSNTMYYQEGDTVTHQTTDINIENNESLEVNRAQEDTFFVRVKVGSEEESLLLSENAVYGYSTIIRFNYDSDIQSEKEGYYKDLFMMGVQVMKFNIIGKYNYLELRNKGMTFVRREHTYKIPFGRHTRDEYATVVVKPEHIKYCNKPERNALDNALFNHPELLEFYDKQTGFIQLER